MTEYPPKWFKTASSYFVEKHGLTQVQKAIIKNLLESDGELSPDELADSSGYHVGTIYNSLRGIDELLDRGYGSVQFNDTELSKSVQKAVQTYGLESENAGKEDS